MLESSLLYGLLGLLTSNISTGVDLTSNFSQISVPVAQKTLPLQPPAAYTHGGDNHVQVLFARGTADVQHGQDRLCVVTPYGWGRDDAPQIQAAVEKCGTNGTITLPAPFVYTIKTRLYTKLVRSRLNVFGTLSFVPDLGYWIHNSHRIEFQNQSTSWIVEGNDFVVDGGGWMQGGINGNGQAWYTHAQGQSNQFGRPIPMTIYNSTNATITNFSVVEPQFWSFLVQDSSNITLKSIYINGTNTDPYGNSSNFETNLDGLNTFRVNNLVARDWVFKGGDDCVTPKSNSSNMIFHNLTCIGGGVAVGSLGQYKDAPDFVSNITVTDVRVKQLIRPGYGGAVVSAGAYFKSWVGVSAGTPPQGGRGGTGATSNISFSRLEVNNTLYAVYVNKCYYKVSSQANYCDTSTFKFQGLSFCNVSGLVSGVTAVNLNCSAAAPCTDLTFENVTATSLNSRQNTTSALCSNVAQIDGLSCA